MTLRIHEHRYRSLVKAASWRLVGTLDTIAVSWVLTRRFTTALSIGGIEVFTKLLIYYLHERAWNRIKLGKVERIAPEYHI
jgi:uncharacterized membrane protein